ncbi:hypothetical protein [Dickeya poaceiphila]|uniref:Lipoprotein n=1 Tax=Dickeya poaceiphila TaxID=568768 RepID=A0A5B8I4J5_9GAMM|nr:hypothetical protein [Dickeya poaceiphila]QDX29564.1 hypothetical protein Dpoa569_0001349 [Dickeya poaceiphila]
MNKKIVLLLALSAAGCAMTPEQIKEYQRTESETYEPVKEFWPNGHGRTWYKSVKELKQDYLSHTGSNLTADTSKCGTDKNCYHTAYLSAFDNGIREFDEKEKQAADKKEKDCQASKECMDNRSITKYSQQLQMRYQYLLSSNPYQQSDIDYAVRTICERAAGQQSIGVPLDEVVTRLQDAPGLDPNSRIAIVDIAKSCWNLQQLKYDWKKSLRV